MNTNFKFTWSVTPYICQLKPTAYQSRFAAILAMFLKCLLLIAGALSSSLVRATQAGLVHSPIKATRGPASLDSRSPNVLILKHGSGTHGSRSSGLLADAMKRTNRDSNTTFLIAEELGSEYVTDIVVGNKTFTGQYSSSAKTDIRSIALGLC